MVVNFLSSSSTLGKGDTVRYRKVGTTRIAQIVVV
nr:MAG TPA: hypothetical protein [Caudoviricetes sp.]